MDGKLKLGVKVDKKIAMGREPSTQPLQSTSGPSLFPAGAVGESASVGSDLGEGSDSSSLVRSSLVSAFKRVSLLRRGKSTTADSDDDSISSRDLTSMTSVNLVKETNVAAEAMLSDQSLRKKKRRFVPIGFDKDSLVQKSSVAFDKKVNDAVACIFFVTSFVRMSVKRQIAMPRNNNAESNSNISLTRLHLSMKRSSLKGFCLFFN